MPKSLIHENYLIKAFHQQIDEKSLDNHIITALETDKEFLAFSFSISDIDVLAVLEQIKSNDDFQFYWEQPTSEFSIAASGELIRITNQGETRYRESSTRGKELLAKVHHLKGINHQNAEVHLFGGFSFFDQNTSEIWKDFDASSFTLPKWMIIREGKCTILTIVIPVESNDLKAELINSIYDLLAELDPICNAIDYELDEELNIKTDIQLNQVSDFDLLHWKETVNRAKDSIIEGEFEKVVLARELIIEIPRRINDTHILHKLRRQYPDCYSFLIKHNHKSSFIGCTPERLASFRANYILTEGLAGSISRGRTASEDVVLENSLLNSDKDRHEHEIVLEDISERLEPFSKTIKHPEQPSVKKLSNVQHLYTPITATIKEGVSRTEVLKNLHPTPAVGGYPRKAAVRFIRKHEDFDRGWYASPIGWINTSGNGEFAVAIRSGLIMDKEVRFFAGCGIVQDSDPQKEWDETNMKFIPMLTALEYAGS